MLVKKKKCIIFEFAYLSGRAFLRRGNAAGRLLGLRVRMSPGAWMYVLSVVCCKLEVSGSGRSLVQRSPTECVYVCVCECVYVCVSVCV